MPELREPRQLRDENRRLTGLVADPSLDKEILQAASHGGEADRVSEAGASERALGNGLHS